MKKVMLGAGVLAVLLSAGLMFSNMLEDIRAGSSAGQTAHELSDLMESERIEKISITYAKPPEPRKKKSAPAAKPSPTPHPVLELNGRKYLGLLDISPLPVGLLPVNVEVTEESLKKTPCRWSGDLSGSLVIGGHNYSRHFGGLPRLKSGDSVSITDTNEVRHDYKVDKISKIHENEFENIINTRYDLTLFTCTKTRVERVVVRLSKSGTVTPPPPPSPTPSPTPTPKVKVIEPPRAPNYKINYKKETIKFNQGTLYSAGNGVEYTEVKEESVTLDISDCITSGVPIYAKKISRDKKPDSKVQTIKPAARAKLKSRTLAPVKGRINLDEKYEVYNPSTQRWGGLPRVWESGEFEIRIKNTAKREGGKITGKAASLTGSLVVAYGEYSPGKKGIVSAEIIAP
ncbi:MAG: sortase [Oscillospiraceae bacterium]|nr:sortase [Oscillospiraceae bacterium]